MSGDSQSLIEQACSGDRPALERLLISHTNQLRDHLARGLPARLQSTVAVEDVVQEALTQAFLRIELLRDSSPEAFATWLKTIGDMTLVDFIRKEDAQKRGGQFRRRRLTSDSVSDSLVDLIEKLPSEAVTASRAVARQEGIAALQVAIAGLADDQRQAIQLHLLEGQTLEETAQAMGRSTGAVRGLVHRAKENLGQAMGRASVWLSQR